MLNICVRFFFFGGGGGGGGGGRGSAILRHKCFYFFPISGCFPMGGKDLINFRSS